LSEACGLRLDKWLWHARFIRSRALAAELVGRRRVRINDHLVAKTHHLVHPGDVITLRLGERLHVVRVAALGLRRGPASEARELYEELVCEG
jgi:ribosome-associated heat shock protein Hsp15